MLFLAQFVKNIENIFTAIMELKLYIDYVAQAFEITGVLIILIGTTLSLAKYILNLKKAVPQAYKLLRKELGKGILLGLEVLVAGDIIATVASKPDMKQVLTLGLIVLIRTFLSLSIEIEDEGRIPWKSRNGK